MPRTISPVSRSLKFSPLRFAQAFNQFENRGNPARESYFPGLSRFTGYPCRGLFAGRQRLCTSSVHRFACPRQSTPTARLPRAHQPAGASQEPDRPAGPRHHGELGSSPGQSLQYLPYRGSEEHRPQRQTAAQFRRRLPPRKANSPPHVRHDRRDQRELHFQDRQLGRTGQLRNLPSRSPWSGALRGSAGWRQASGRRSTFNRGTAIQVADLRGFEPDLRPLPSKRRRLQSVQGGKARTSSQPPRIPTTLIPAHL